MNRKWMLMLMIILFLGAMIASGCGVSKQGMMDYNEAKDTLQKATAAGAKKCAPCQYATAEAALAQADHELAEINPDTHSTHFVTAVKTLKEKSLEALNLTPCEKPAPPPPPPPPPPPKAAPVFETVYFNENKTNIDPMAAKALDQNGAILNENPDIKVEIGGHTDSMGSEEGNQKTSEKRAESAKKYLMDKFGIADDRLIIKGYGSTMPIADNKTPEGRSKNRRVEFKVIP